MEIQCYLNFDGNCRDAVEFYGRVFGAEPKILTFGDMPANPDFPIEENMKDLITHANLEFCGIQLMLSDTIPDTKFICGNNITLSIKGGDKDKMTSWFQGLTEGGTVNVPLGQAFFSELYGSVTDRFGISWQVIHTK